MKNIKKIKKLGIITMQRISVGGGFPRVARDLIAHLNKMNIEVSLLTPYNVDLDRIAQLYGSIKIKKIYYPSRLKTALSKEEMFGRKLLIPEFKKFTKDMDFIIDMDGGVFHNYIPTDFDKNNYVIWKISCIDPKSYEVQNIKSLKVLIKLFIKKFINKFSFREKDIPKCVRIYPVDEWTKRELIKFWKVKPQKMCLYPEIKVDEFSSRSMKKEQIVVLGRIAPNKSIEESIKIFAEGTKKFQKYKLIILGGATSDSENYISQLKKVIKENELENQIEIIKDPSFNLIKKTLSESKVIIDSQKNVSMTMTSVEAMASGCIVLSQKNAGTYLEVLEKGKFGYGFSNVEEGSKTLNEILSKLRSKNMMVSSAIKRARFFSPKKFEERLGEILRPKEI